MSQKSEISDFFPKNEISETFQIFVMYFLQCIATYRYKYFHNIFYIISLPLFPPFI